MHGASRPNCSTSTCGREGRPLFIEGRLKFDSWETKDGQRRNKLSVVIDNFQFVDGGGGGGEGGGGNRESYSRDSNRDQAPAPGRGSPQVQAGKVSDSGGGGQAQGGQRQGGQHQGGGEEYDFEDIPF
jgi:single-stranded DNA-binding protein